MKTRSNARRRTAVAALIGTMCLAAAATTASATTVPTEPTDTMTDASMAPADTAMTDGTAMTADTTGAMIAGSIDISAASIPPFDMEPVSGELIASGATFPMAFYTEAIAEVEGINPDLVVEYSGGGSGKGRTDLAQSLVDFAGTDAPVKEEDMAGFAGEFVYIPTVVAPITMSYHLEGVDTLNLTPATIAGIFQLQITTWNDDAIATDNPDVDLPDENIVVVRRADGSGTTENFTRFLDTAVGEGGDGTWTLGFGSEVEWPDGTQAGDGNPGVAQIIADTEGAIGYVDLSDANANGFTYASVQNKAGNFIAPTLEATTAAVEGVEINEDLTFFTGWADGDEAYPIAAQTWIIVYTDQDPETAAALQYFLTYLLTDGQALAQEVDFAPLPPGLRQAALDNVAKIGA